MERNVLRTIGLPFDVSPVNSNAADVLPHRRRYPLETVVLSQSLDRSVLVVLTNRMARTTEYGALVSVGLRLLDRWYKAIKQHAQEHRTQALGRQVILHALVAMVDVPGQRPQRPRAMTVIEVVLE